MKCKWHPDEWLDPDVDSIKRFEGKGYCKKCDVFWPLDQPKPENLETLKKKYGDFTTDHIKLLKDEDEFLTNCHCDSDS